MRAVNLLPREEVKRSFEAKRGVAFGAAGGAAVVTAVLAAALISAGGARSEQQAALDARTAELAALPQPTPAPTDAGSSDAGLAADKAARIGALSGALGTRVPWDRVLLQVSQVLPEDVRLTSLTSGGVADAAATAAGARGIVLNGSAYSHDGVARVLARLSVAPVLSNVRLRSSTSTLVADRKLVLFTIEADIRTAGGAS